MSLLWRRSKPPCAYLLAASFITFNLSAQASPKDGETAEMKRYPGAVLIDAAHRRKQPKTESVQTVGKSEIFQKHKARTPETTSLTEQASPDEQAASTTDAEQATTSDGQATKASGDQATSEEQEKASAALFNKQQALRHYYLASHYLSKWELDLAQAELDETIKCSPDFKVAHRDICLISLVKFRLGRALAEFMMVVGLGDAIPYNEKERHDLDQNAMHRHYNRALAWIKQHQWREAATEYEWALSYIPDDGSVRHSLAFAYANLGDFKKAEDQYAQAFKLAPSDGFAHADLANLMDDKGQTAKAEAELEKAVALEPSAAALHVDLGWVAESRGDLATAIPEFQSAVQLSPNHAELWAHLGRMLEKHGEAAEAGAAYQRALSLDPARSDARASLERLKTQNPGPRATKVTTS